MSKQTARRAGLTIAMLVVPHGASAQSIDPAVWTCAQFTTARNSADPSEQLGASLVVAWMMGRAAPQTPQARVDLNAVTPNATKLDSLCQAAPAASLQQMLAPLIAPDSYSSDALEVPEFLCSHMTFTTIEDAADMAAMVFWHIGHSSHGEATPRIETGALERYTARTGDACRKAPQSTFADAVKQAIDMK